MDLFRYSFWSNPRVLLFLITYFFLSSLALPNEGSLLRGDCHYIGVDTCPYSYQEDILCRVVGLYYFHFPYERSARTLALGRVLCALGEGSRGILPRLQDKRSKTLV